jgi:large subunit ribosomal protein L25
MADQVALAAHPRVGSGKGEARSLRREGRVPAIAYGTDLDPTPVSVDALELYHALRTDAGENAILRLELVDGSHLALAREIQRHPVKRHIQHVDFVTVSRDVKVQVDVPLVLEGHAPGVDEGGVLEQQLHAVPIEVLPLEVPDQLVLDVSDMQVGDIKRLEELPLPEGVEVLEDLERTVVTLNVPQMEVPETEVPEEEAAAEDMAEGDTAEEAAEAEGVPTEAAEE